MSQPQTQPQSQPQFPTQRKSTPLAQLPKKLQQPPMPAQMQLPLMMQSAPHAQAQAQPPTQMMQPAPPMRPQVQNHQQPHQQQFPPQFHPSPVPTQALDGTQPTDGYVAELEPQIPEDAFELYNNIDSEVLATLPTLAQQPHGTIPYQIKQDAVVQSMCNPDDLQMFAVITIVFLVVSLLPMGSLIEKYVAIDKVPHGEDIVKALVAGVVVFLIIKLMRA